LTGSDCVVPLACLDIELSLAEVYAGVDLDEAAA
jgi:hypothetical protein